MKDESRQVFLVHPSSFILHPSEEGRQDMNQATPTIHQPTAAERDLTGRTLGDFLVLRHLGRGGMGEVYLAEQVSLKRNVALKILRSELAADPIALQRFKAEAEAVARVTHANIVQVYAIGSADGITFMALEYVEGRNLRDYLSRKGPPDVLLALGIMRQVAAALQRAGEMGIVHRDVKPENILLTRKGEVKVADFGLSRCLIAGQPPTSLTQSGVTMGTPLYMSPEQVEGRTLDPRSDIYSFGVTCYHLLAGQPPFRGETAFEVALQHVRAEPPPLASVRPDLPAALCAVVHRMMAKEPDQRYQTCRELLKDLARIRESLSGQTAAISLPVSAEVAVPPPVPTAPLPRPAQSSVGRRGRRLLVVLSLLAALGAGAGFAAFRRQADHFSGPVTPPPDETRTSLLRWEQAQREVVEGYLNGPAASRTDVQTRTTVCRDLALFYLENDRLDEAEQLFARLAKTPGRPAHLIAHCGQAIVLALQSRPEESNKLFRETLGVRNHTAADKKADNLPLWQNERWRYWLTRAVHYNRSNGVPPKDMPPILQRLLAPR
jgi:serine/threonine protein kinase